MHHKTQQRQNNNRSRYNDISDRHTYNGNSSNPNHAANAKFLDLEKCTIPEYQLQELLYTAYQEGRRDINSKYNDKTDLPSENKAYQSGNFIAI